MLGRLTKSEKAAFAQGILSTFGKLDECDIEQIDGRLERLIALLMVRYSWSDEYARRKIRESFPKNNAPNQLRSPRFGLVGQGFAILSFLTRQRSPGSDASRPFSNAVGTAVGLNYRCNRVHHADSMF